MAKWDPSQNGDIVCDCESQELGHQGTMKSGWIAVEVIRTPKVEERAPLMMLALYGLGRQQHSQKAVVRTGLGMCVICMAVRIEGSGKPGFWQHGNWGGVIGTPRASTFETWASKVKVKPNWERRSGLNLSDLSHDKCSSATLLAGAVLWCLEPFSWEKFLSRRKAKEAPTFQSLRGAIKVQRESHAKGGAQSE